MIYSITYNNNQIVDTGHLHRIITTAIMAEDWWHYIPNLYLVNTPLNSTQITSTLQLQFPGLLFLIIKIDTTDYNGVLPRDAWTWIEKHSTKKMLKIKKVTNTTYSAPTIKLSDIIKKK